MASKLKDHGGRNRPSCSASFERLGFFLTVCAPRWRFSVIIHIIYANVLRVGSAHLESVSLRKLGLVSAQSMRRASQLQLKSPREYLDEKIAVWMRDVGEIAFSRLRI